VANTILKPSVIARTALGLLEREIILPGLVWTDAVADFAGAEGDTVTIRVPARTTARTRALRVTRPTASEGEGIITMDSLAQTSVDVTIDTDIYNAIPITDEEMTFDIEDFGRDILQPQVRAVAEGLENMLAAEMVGATYATTLTLDTTDPYNTMVDGRVALNKANVPMANRIAVVGADMEGVILKSKHLSEVDKSGSDSALRDAIIGRMAGFGNVYVSNALPPDEGYLFHRTAFVLGMRAPVVPRGATYGQSQRFQNLALRWLMDYDGRNQQDRSFVNVYAGTAIVADGPNSNEVQNVTITGSPTGGTFTLTYAGQTTSGIAYNASASTVQSALEALSNIAPGDVVVTGTGPYTVTFTGTLAGSNVAQMTASGASLTGGTSPAVNVTTSGAGGDATFVRAVKLVMA
jgi:hypothetical protein